MKIQTKYHGQIELKNEQLFHFAKGLPAFESEKQFVLLSLEEESPFYVLQSTETADVAFICVEPFSYIQDYQVQLSKQVIEELNITSNEQVAIFVLLTVKEPFMETTANLQGPIVLNMKKQKGRQFMMNDSLYQTKERIFKQSVVKGEK
ncbi:flagellar assembly protein FliW [Alkalihalobacillus pseudalcaliphilus]|uniref:flagellar assembly protein FliW n=1 Tax=Alkalihalobacillus pseudalcaliphilus TaxID=79884 RepID=UPI00064DBCC6|nr:flagellar assembly protein FliW [Alkalihalobacillus pseudalcaliphilus]KMK77429.1 flagellar assembly protein FliW [Alkalihalobacillus pseudalcaliphilus]